MGQEDDINAAVSHIALCCVAGRGITRLHNGRSFTAQGMHANFFIHGILGFLHYQSGTFNADFSAAYNLSHKATRYLALPCLMADIYRSDNMLCSLHLVSGLVPFAMAMTGKDNMQLGNMVIVCNILCLCYYSAQSSSRKWGWYTAGAALIAYFMAPQAGQKMMYPLGLALMDYCAYRVFTAHFIFPDI